MNYSFFKEDYINAVNKTYRGKGAVGKNAIVPRIVERIAKPTDRILDFGSGKIPYHTLALRKKGLQVDAWEIGDNFNRMVHLSACKSYSHDIVFASNVMNVQRNPGDIVFVLNTSCIFLKKSGILIFNYPASPRKSDLSTEEFREGIVWWCDNVYGYKHPIQIAGTKNAPVYLVSHRSITPMELFLSKGA